MNTLFSCLFGCLFSIATSWENKKWNFLVNSDISEMIFVKLFDDGVFDDGVWLMRKTTINENLVVSLIEFVPRYQMRLTWSGIEMLNVLIYFRDRKRA